MKLTSLANCAKVDKNIKSHEGVASVINVASQHTGQKPGLF